MDLKIVIISILFTPSILSFRHENPKLETVWTERCGSRDVALNDCNWCWCGKDHSFKCASRVCEQVDMFGHFKDAIQEIDVGMEGHGSWRTRPKACVPGVHYRRGDILCVCDEFGDWPNPVCRDLFRVLYLVEPTGLSYMKNQTCTPTKLYLLGCNVCYCPKSGYLNEKFCTRQECQYDDPIFRAEKLQANEESNNAQEIYATCNPADQYLLGCRKCTCLQNNRLVCNACSPGNNPRNSYCHNKAPGYMFNKDCNICKCVDESNMYCSSKKCLGKSNLKTKKTNELRQLKLLHLYGCKPDAHFDYDCNSCKCLEKNGEMFMECSTNVCTKHEFSFLNDCVENTMYELNCMICHCIVVLGEKRQVCRSNPKCVTDLAVFEKRSRNINRLHGYCEPLHKYKNDCNNCSCMLDGKTLKCTSEICKSKEPLVIEVIPFKLPNAQPCRNGHSYKVNCNTCFCLSNGNAICTTVDCSNNNKNPLL